MALSIQFSIVKLLFFANSNCINIRQSCIKKDTTYVIITRPYRLWTSEYRLFVDQTCNADCELLRRDYKDADVIMINCIGVRYCLAVYQTCVLYMCIYNEIVLIGHIK